MTTYPIDVVINPAPAQAGASVVSRSIQAMERQALALRRSLDTAVTGGGRVAQSIQTMEVRALSFGRVLRTALAALGVASVTREIFQLTDEFARLTNRLNVVETSTIAVKDAQRDLLGIANRTRQDFGSVVEVYVRARQAVEQLGISSDRTRIFTENLNKAVALSGAGTAESRAGLIQLSQGLASGRLQGEELRSVLENIPVAADVIARGLNVPRGELRKLASEGRITSQVIIEAFEKAGSFLDERFAKTVVTPSQAFQVLKNNLLAFVGGAGQATGFTEKLSAAILFLANNIDGIARGAAAAGIAISSLFVARGIQSAIVGLKALRAAALANPFLLAVTGIGTAIGLLVSFGDQIKIGAGEITTLQDVSLATWDVVKESAASAVDYVLALFPEIPGGLQLNLRTVLQAVAYTSDKIAGFFVGSFRVISEALNTLPQNWEAVGQLVLKAVRDLVENTLNFIISGTNAAAKTITRIVGLSGQVIANYSAALGALSVGNQEAAQSLFESADTAAQQIKFAAQGFAGTFRQELLKGADNPLLPEVELTKQAADLGQQFGATFVEGVESVTGARDLVGKILGQADLRAENRVAERAKAEAERRQAEAAEKAANEALKTSSDPSQIPFTTAKQGALEFFTEVRRQAQDMATVVKDAFGVFQNAAETAFNELLTTGRVNTRALADSVLQELQRIIVKMLVIQALNLIPGIGQFGPLLGAASGIGNQQPARAAGGPVQAGRAYTVGERGPETFIPASNGTIVPNGGQAASAPTIKVVNIQDPKQSLDALGSAEGESVVFNMLARRKGRLRQLLG